MEKPTNISIIIHSSGLGGAELIALESAQMLSKNKKFHITVGADKNNYFRIGNLESIPNELNIKFGPFGINKYLKRNLLNNIYVVIGTIKFIFFNKPDLIILHLPFHNHGIPVIYALMLMKIKTVIIYHLSPFVHKPHKIFKKIVNKHLNKILYLVAVSKHNQEKIALSINKNIDEIKLIHNGIKWGKSVFSSKEKLLLKKELSIKPNDIIFITTARIIANKGYNELLEAATILQKTYSNLRFIWVGTGPEESHLTKKIKALNLDSNFILLGHRSNILQFLKIADYYILPSHIEGLSLSLLEAVSQKIPIITSDACSNSEVIENKLTGLLFKTKKSWDLVAKIEWALKHPERMKEMADKGYSQNLQYFSIHRMIKQQINLIETIVSKNE